MKAYNFYILTIDDMDSIDRKELFNNLGKATDWQKVTTGAYIIKTSLSMDIWEQRLTRLTEEKNIGFFISVIDVNKVQGFLPDVKWNWFKNTSKYHN